MQFLDYGSLVRVQDAAAATGDGLEVSVTNYGGVAVEISGTFSGTVTFEASGNGDAWFAVSGTNRTSGTAANTATAPGLYVVKIPGCHRFRARVSAYTSGNITVDATPFPIFAI